MNCEGKGGWEEGDVKEEVGGMRGRGWEGGGGGNLSKTEIEMELGYIRRYYVNFYYTIRKYYTHTYMYNVHISS